MNTQINKTVLMSGPKYFSVQALNPYSDVNNQPYAEGALKEFEAIKSALQKAGVKVVKVDEPAGCQDGIFTANWAICRSNRCVLASLPKQRQAEEPYAEKYLRDLGKEVIKAPFTFSGQGDALPCGNLLFAGSGYRTDLRMHEFLAQILGYEVISLQTVPLLNSSGQPAINKLTGLHDSFFYDIDLSVSVLRNDLIAWCPEALTQESQAKIRALKLNKIEIQLDEALKFACNLVSTGQIVIMGEHTPKLKNSIEAHGLEVVTVNLKELSKGGGFVRCTTLTLDN